MKIIKVIVDEVPESCFECDFRFVSEDFDFLTERCSLIDGGYVDHNKRPDWCPLYGGELYMVKGKAKPGSYRNARGAIQMVSQTENDAVKPSEDNAVPDRFNLNGIETWFIDDTQPVKVR